MQTLRILSPKTFFADNPPHQLVRLTRKNKPDTLPDQFRDIVDGPLWDVWQLVWNGDGFPSVFLPLTNNSLQVNWSLLNPTRHWESNEAGEFCFNASIMAYDQKAQRHVTLGVYFLADVELDGIRQRSIFFCLFRPTILRHALFLFQKYFQR
jgi:hypothetical protein